jgi:hypothetical protein
MNIQNNNFIIGLNVIPRTLDGSRIGKAKRTRMAVNIATTPKSLLGIERSIA